MADSRNNQYGLVSIDHKRATKQLLYDKLHASYTPRVALDENPIHRTHYDVN